MKKTFNEQEVIGRFQLAEDIVINNLCPGSGYERTMESFQDMLEEAERKGVKDEICQILNNVTLFKYSKGVGYDRLYFGGWGDIEHVTPALEGLSTRNILVNLEIPEMGLNREGYSYMEGDPTIVEEDLHLHNALIWGGTYRPL